MQNLLIKMGKNSHLKFCFAKLQNCKKYMYTKNIYPLRISPYPNMPWSYGNLAA